MQWHVGGAVLSCQGRLTRVRICVGGFQGGRGVVGLRERPGDGVRLPACVDDLLVIYRLRFEIDALAAGE